MCMRRQGQGELLPFDPELERTLNRLRIKRNLAVAEPGRGRSGPGEE